MATTRDTVRTLCRSIITRLENRKYIEFHPETRQKVVDGLYEKVGPSILTEEDLRDQTIERVGTSVEALEGNNASEHERFRVAKNVVRKSFGDDELHGLFFQTSLKNIADQVNEFLLGSDTIEEVFADDDTLIKAIVDIVKKFNPAQMS